MRTALQKMGEGGKQLAGIFDEIENIAARRAGNAVAELRKATKGLTPAEKQNLWDVLDTGAAATSERVAGRAAGLRQILDEYAAEAASSGLTIRTKDGRRLPFSRRENFAPHIVKEEVLRDERKLRRAIDHLVQTGQASDQSEAARMLRHYFVFHGRHRYGSLEKARELEMPKEFLETDVEKALSTYFTRGARRLEEARWLGSEDDAVGPLLERIGAEGGDVSFAREATRAFLGLRDRTGFESASQIARSANIVMRMTTSAMINLSQSASTALRTSVWDTARALTSMFVPKVAAANKDLALRSGATLDSVLSEVAAQVGGAGDLPSGILKAVGFNLTERLNRTLAAVAGRNYAQRLAKRLAGNSSDARATRELKRLGIDPLRAAREGLTDDDLLKAAQQVVRDTQFKTSVQDLPLWWSSPEGKFFTQFKNFTFNQTKLLHNEIIKEMRRDPARAAQNVAKLLTLFPAAGFVLGEGREQVRQRLNAALVNLIGDDRFVEEIEFQTPDESLIDAVLRLPGFRDKPRLAGHAARIIEDGNKAGMFGMFADAAVTATMGDYGWTNFFAGPSSRFLIDTATAGSRVASKLAEGETDEALEVVLREVRRNVPVLNPFISGPGPR